MEARKRAMQKRKKLRTLGKSRSTESEDEEEEEEGETIMSNDVGFIFWRRMFPTLRNLTVRRQKTV